LKEKCHIKFSPVTKTEWEEIYRKGYGKKERKVTGIEKNIVKMETKKLII
jgi:hypothetical protein